MQQRQRLLFLLPLALGLACGCLHRAHAHAHAHGTTPGFVSSASISGRRPAVAGTSGSTTATAATATATVALPPSPGGGHDDDLSTSSSHICHAWCGCARRRHGQQQRGRAATRLWAAKKEAEAGALRWVLGCWDGVMLKCVVFEKGCGVAGGWGLGLKGVVWISRASIDCIGRSTSRNHGD